MRKEATLAIETASRLRIVFWGSSEFALPTLEYLLREPAVEVALVITRCPMPAGRGRATQPTVLGQLVRERCPEIPLAEPRKLKGNEQLQERIRGLAPNAYILAAYGKFVPQEFLDLTPYPLALHPSPLPLLRGPSPVRTALIQGMSETGVSLFRMIQEMDAGDIVLFMRLPILPQDDYGTLHERLALLAVQVTREGVELLRGGRVMFLPQDSSRATLTRLFGYEDTFLDFSRSAEELQRFVRAMSPDLGAVCLSPCGRKVKLLQVHPVPCEKAGLPGEIVLLGKKKLVLATGDGCLEVETLQPENRRVMNVQEWLAGQKLVAGQRFRTPRST